MICPGSGLPTTGPMLSHGFCPKCKTVIPIDSETGFAVEHEVAE